MYVLKRKIFEERERVVNGFEERGGGYQLGCEMAAGEEVAAEDLSVDLTEVFDGF